jgi:glutaconate CoA-transferase subunit A
MDEGRSAMDDGDERQAGKLLSLAAAAELVQDGQTIAFGGSLLHRSPSALTRELARQGRRGLTFVKPSAAYDVDLLCAAGCLDTVYAGIVVMEGGFGLAPNYRRAVERGKVKLVEHA